MNKTTPAILLAMILSASMLVPTSVADACDTNDADCDLLFATGPVGIFSQDQGGASIALCQLVDDTLPLACEAEAGSLNSLGGVFFNASRYENVVPAGGGMEVTIWAEQIDGPVAEGFQLSGCSDIDDDSFADHCTDGYAGNTDGCDGDDKDKKDCGNNETAGFTGCAFRDDWFEIVDPTDPGQDIHHTDMDDYVVFVAAWTDSTVFDESVIYGSADKEESNTVAVGAGTFAVYADWGADLTADQCAYEAYGSPCDGDFADWDQDHVAVPAGYNLTVAQESAFCSDGLLLCILICTIEVLNITLDDTFAVLDCALAFDPVGNPNAVDDFIGCVSAAVGGINPTDYIVLATWIIVCIEDYLL